MAEANKTRRKKMAKYKKKPVVIEAIRFIGSNYEEIREFIILTQKNLQIINSAHLILSLSEYLI